MIKFIDKLLKVNKLTKFLKLSFSIVLSGSLLGVLSGCSEEHRFTGYIEGEYLYIAPAIAGRLEVLSVKRGDWVKLDDPLYQLEHQFELDGVEQALHALLSAESTLQDMIKGKRPDEITALMANRDQSQITLNLSEIRFGRNMNLIKEGGVSQDQLDESATNVGTSKESVIANEANLRLGYLGSREDQIEAQRENVKAADAVLKQAQWKLDQKTLFSPAEGYVQDTFFNPGEWVNDAVPVVSILPPEKVKVRFFVSERKLGVIRLNQKIRVRCDSCKKNIFARVNYISTQAEFTPPVIFSHDTRDKLVYLIEAELPREDAMKLHPGQPVDVVID